MKIRRSIKSRMIIAQKLCASLLALTLLSLMLFQGSLATDYISETWTFSVSYLGTPGEYYSLVAVEGDSFLSEMPVLTEKNIIYINQKTAPQSGIVQFADFSPMRETIGTLYLGASNLDSPILLGRISNGVFEFAYNDDKIVVEYNGNGGKVVIPEGTIGISDIGIFENKGVTEIFYPSSVLQIARILVGAKSYYSHASRADFTGITPGADSTIYIIGDHNNDAKVNYLDLRFFLQNRSAPSDHPIDTTQADINSDGKASLADASALLDIITG